MNLKLADQAIEAFDDYYRRQDSASAGNSNNLGIEARKRLIQCRKIVTRAIEIEGALPDIKADPAAHIAGVEDLEMTTEHFYWVAGRTRSILRAMPGLSNFESPGVRNTRNKLIEHPEKGDSQVVINSFGFGAVQGPVLKAMRYEDQINIFPDAGLYANAEQFFQSVIDKTTETAVSPTLKSEQQ